MMPEDFAVVTRKRRDHCNSLYSIAKETISDIQQRKNQQGRQYLLKSLESEPNQKLQDYAESHGFNTLPQVHLTIDKSCDYAHDSNIPPAHLTIRWQNSGNQLVIHAHFSAQATIQSIVVKIHSNGGTTTENLPPSLTTSIRNYSVEARNILSSIITKKYEKLCDLNKELSSSLNKLYSSKSVNDRRQAIELIIELLNQINKYSDKVIDPREDLFKQRLESLNSMAIKATTEEHREEESCAGTAESEARQQKRVNSKKKKKPIPVVDEISTLIKEIRKKIPLISTNINYYIELLDLVTSAETLLILGIDDKRKPQYKLLEETLERVPKIDEYFKQRLLDGDVESVRKLIRFVIPYLTFDYLFELLFSCFAKVEPTIISNIVKCIDLLFKHSDFYSVFIKISEICLVYFPNAPREEKYLGLMYNLASDSYKDTQFFEMLLHHGMDPTNALIRKVESSEDAICETFAECIAAHNGNLKLFEIMRNHGFDLSLDRPPAVTTYFKHAALNTLNHTSVRSLKEGTINSSSTSRLLLSYLRLSLLDTQKNHKVVAHIAARKGPADIASAIGVLIDDIGLISFLSNSDISGVSISSQRSNGDFISIAIATEDRLTLKKILSLCQILHQKITGDLLKIVTVLNHKAERFLEIDKRASEDAAWSAIILASFAKTNIDDFSQQIMQALLTLFNLTKNKEYLTKGYKLGFERKLINTQACQNIFKTLVNNDEKLRQLLEQNATLVKNQSITAYDIVFYLMLRLAAIMTCYLLLGDEHSSFPIKAISMIGLGIGAVDSSRLLFQYSQQQFNHREEETQVTSNKFKLRC